MKKTKDIKVVKRFIDDIFQSLLSPEQIRKGLHVYGDTHWILNTWNWPCEHSKNSKNTVADKISLINKVVKASTLKIAITGGRDGYYRVDIDVNKNEFFNEQFFCSKDHVYVLDKNSAVFIILTKLIEQIKRQAAPILEYVN